MMREINMMTVSPEDLYDELHAAMEAREAVLLDFGDGRLMLASTAAYRSPFAKPAEPA